MFGRSKKATMPELEIVQDHMGFRAGLYDRDMHELRATLSALLGKLDLVIENQIRLDETTRRVGIVSDRNARWLAERADHLTTKLDNVAQAVANVREALGQRLDEAVNQIVASQQDMVGQLRRASERVATTAGSGSAHEPSGRGEETYRVKDLAGELKLVIPMIVGGETSKAVELLTAIYSRIEAASSSGGSGLQAASEGTKKRTAGLRSSWNKTGGELASQGRGSPNNGSGKNPADENAVVSEEPEVNDNRAEVKLRS